MPRRAAEGGSMDAIALSYRPLTIYGDRIEIQSEERTQFIDLTEWVRRSLVRSGIEQGIAQIRVLHTTAAVVVNENEPQLLGDFRAMLERLVPWDGVYAHDDPARLSAAPEPGERPNGPAHARALLLGDSKQIAVTDGRLELGRWQSIFLVELDGPRERSVCLTLLGHPRNL
jgi:secondary thiamine-phosphate synthase enzyme